MGCVNADGTVSAVARGVLESLASGATAKDVAASAGVPLYRVRASLRELEGAGFVDVDGEVYRLTDAGTALLTD